jgi:hypothetical protein
VVLLEDGRTEQRHDAVALQLGHGPFEAGDRFAHLGHDGAQPMGGVLGIEMVDQRG